MDTKTPIKVLYEAVEQLAVSANRIGTVIIWGTERAEWDVELAYRGKTLRLPFYTSPDKNHVDDAEVLYSIGSDIASVEQWWEKDRAYVPFEQWCEEYGYDDDKISHKKIYDEIVNMAKTLQEVLGSEYDMLINYFYEELEF